MKALKRFLFLLSNVSIVLLFQACIDDPTPNEGTDADISHFEFAYLTGEVKRATIDRQNKTIEAYVSVAADLKALRPVFVLSDGAKAYINDVEQISGVSQNDFTKMVEYKIVSRNQKDSNFYRVMIVAGVDPVTPTGDMVFNQNTFLPAGEYFVNGNITIEDNVYFELRPGVVFKLGENSKIIVKPNVRFKAVGTEEMPIIFTSIESTKAWGGFEFSSAEEVEFDHCNINNGGSNIPMLTAYNTKIGFQRSKVKDIGNTGFLLDEQSMFRIFDHNELDNVANQVNSYPIHFKTINAISNLSIYNDIKTTTGIYVEKSDINNSLTLQYQPCPYIFADDITCSVPDISFFIRDGVVIKMANGKGIYLGNTPVLFKAEGSVANPITITGLENIAGCWNGIVLDEKILIGSNISYCNVLYGGNNTHNGAIRCSGTEKPFAIQNCSISYTNSNGIYFEKNAVAELSNNKFSNIPIGFSDVYYEP